MLSHVFYCVAERILLISGARNFVALNESPGIFGAVEVTFATAKVGPKRDPIFDVVMT